LSHSIVANEFRALATTRVFTTRVALWDECLLTRLGREQKVTAVEYWVHTGQSIKYFAK
jgi:hypothetical protein